MKAIFYAIGMALIFAGSNAARGCGISWIPPYGAFCPVTDDGYIQIWYKPARLKLKSGLEVPCWIDFSSKDLGRKSLLGAGWTCPLLESRVIQISQDNFVLLQPDGQEVQMQRDSQSKDVIHGVGWVGILKTNSIELSASCGWKAVYVAGKIRELSSPQGDHLEYQYTNDELSTVTQDESKLISVQRDAFREQTSLDGMDHRIDCRMVSYPCYAVASGHPMLVMISKTIGELTAGTLDTKFAYNFDDDHTEEMVVTDGLETHDYRWNIQDGKVTTADGWSYAVDLAACARRGYRVEKFKLGDREHSSLYAWEPDTGIEQQRLNGGNLVTITHFVSGVEVGKIRKIESVDSKGVTHLLDKRDYDESGRLIAVRNADSRMVTSNSTTKSVTWSDNAARRLTAIYDAQNKLSSFSVNGRTYFFVDKQDDDFIFRRDDSTVIHLPSSALIALTIFPEEASKTTIDRK